MKYKPYPAYKPSGVEWIGDVPVGWEVRKLKYKILLDPSKNEVLKILSFDDEVTFLPMAYISEEGDINAENDKKLEDVFTGYTYFRDNDVVVAKITPCFENGKGALIASMKNGIGFGTTEFFVLRTNVLDEKYLFYLTKSNFFRKVGEAHMKGAAGQKRIPDSFIKDFKVGFPIRTEQKQIANFLDQKTGQIDDLIQKKQKMIKLLKEKRAALINQAIKKGLDPNTKMKASGIDWIGDIPDGWEVRRLKYVSYFQRGFDLPVTEFQNGDIPVYGSNGIIGFHNIATTKFPSITIGRSGSVGEVNLIMETYWAHNTALFLLNNYGNHVKYLFYMLNCVNLKSESSGCAVGTLNRNNIHQIKVGIPPVREQKKIVEYLDKKTTEFDSLIERIEAAIAKLREYRSAIITAAVTGKMDMRDGR